MQNVVGIAEGQLAGLGHKIPCKGQPVAAETLLVETVGGAGLKARKLELVAMRDMLSEDMLPYSDNCIMEGPAVRIAIMPSLSHCRLVQRS